MLHRPPALARFPLRGRRPPDGSPLPSRAPFKRLGKLCCHQVKITAPPRLPARSARGHDRQGHDRARRHAAIRESAASMRLRTHRIADFPGDGDAEADALPVVRTGQQHKPGPRIADAAICREEICTFGQRGDRYGRACRLSHWFTPSNAGAADIRPPWLRPIRPARGHACEPQYGPNHSNIQVRKRKRAPDRSPQGRQRVPAPARSDAIFRSHERGKSHPQRRVREPITPQSFLRPRLRRARSTLRPPGVALRAKETVAAGAHEDCWVGTSASYHPSKTGAGRPARGRRMATGDQGGRAYGKACHESSNASDMPPRSA